MKVGKDDGRYRIRLTLFVMLLFELLRFELLWFELLGS